MAQQDQQEDAHSQLTDRELAMLALERAWWRNPAAKAERIRAEFGVTPIRYYQQLRVLIERPEALAADPVLVRMLLRRAAGE